MSAEPKPSRSHEARQARLAEARASTAQATAERKAQAEAAQTEAAQTDTDAAPVDRFDRKVGLVEGTFKVFVDIVQPPEGERVFRVFGPPEQTSPPELEQPRTAAAGASSAYARAANSLPLKDLGVA